MSLLDAAFSEEKYEVNLAAIGAGMPLARGTAAMDAAKEGLGAARAMQMAAAQKRFTANILHRAISLI